MLRGYGKNMPIFDNRNRGEIGKAGGPKILLREGVKRKG